MISNSVFKLSVLALGTVALVACSNSEKKQIAAESYVDWVDPLIGSGGHGHVFVGASIPHGMIQLGPNNNKKVGTGVLDIMIQTLLLLDLHIHI